MLNVKKTLTKILEIVKAHDVDYIVEQGVEGLWNYTKWNSGTYEAIYKGGFALNAGTAWQGGYFHETTYGLALPSFALSWELKSATKSDAILMYCVGALMKADGLHFEWVNGSAAAVGGSNFGTAVTIISGTWK